MVLAESDRIGEMLKIKWIFAFSLFSLGSVGEIL